MFNDPGEPGKDASGIVNSIETGEGWRPGQAGIYGRRRRSTTAYIRRTSLHRANFYAKTGSQMLSVDTQGARSHEFKRHSLGS